MPILVGYVTPFRFEVKKQQALEQAFNEVYEEQFAGKDPDDLTDDEKQKLERIKDIYQGLLDS